MTDEPEDDDKVGKGKPPKNRRFGQPGVKGNPRGRPRGSKKQDPVEKFLNELVQVKIDGVRKKRPRVEALLMQLWQDVVARKPYAVNTMLKLIAEDQARRRKRSDTDPHLEAPPGDVYFIGVNPGDVDPETDK